MLGLSQSLRAELEPHQIGVTAICPGMINTAIIEGGKMLGEIDSRKARVAAVFKGRGLAPEVVATAIVEAARTNPAVRTVGRDAWAIHALTRVAPRATTRFGASIARRLGVH